MPTLSLTDFSERVSWMSHGTFATAQMMQSRRNIRSPGLQRSSHTFFVTPPDQWDCGAKTQD